jgi:hypothetical protein
MTLSGDIISTLYNDHFHTWRGLPIMPGMDIPPTFTYPELAPRRSRTAGDANTFDKKRSNTTRDDPTSRSSKKLHRHRHSIQDPPGYDRHHRPQKSSKHHHIKDALSSTIPPGFESLARQAQAKVGSDSTPSSTARDSRRGSQGDADLGDKSTTRQILVKAEDVEKEKWRAKARDE